ncbi:SGNH/GDSL hydrolase family protein [Sanguibacter antarcticus]|uniref:GDSL-like lipase/acylhydrolase family protein n=1 Tax=Sanguibacter antarcticus TaxID=372484 RepID=A0A2A9E2J4_9MICO|nr:SGNH/GDSL hydrolase family protein [Sanguibacter antarcticus]PFG32575.1 GDSL-like lipase/acylhydrolase family protein [Sanguibacter antarcticus]
MTARSLTAVPLTSSLVRGAAELRRTEHGVVPHRLPGWARAQCTDPQLAMVESQPSGVHLAFRTAATEIELDLRRSRTTFAGIPARPDGAIDLVIDGVVVSQAATTGGTTVTFDMSTGGSTTEVGPLSTARFADLPEVLKNVEIWLPHNETIELLELRSNSVVEPGPAHPRPVWMHHGSSISHGSSATRPTGIWPVVAARLADVQLVNLGFGGGALLDPFVARTIRDSPVDLVSVKIGINLVNTDLMRLRAFGPAVHGFLDTIRDGHPTAPLLVVSPIWCAIHEDTPGPGAFDLDALAQGMLRFRATGDPADRAAGKLTLDVIRAELARIVTERRTTDPHLQYLDGRQLYGEMDSAAHPLPDALHPDAPTHQLIGERFARSVLRTDPLSWSL